MKEDPKLTISRVVEGTTGLESQPIAPHLPTELLLIIFSFLAPCNRYAKKPDIRSCRLVCHRWANTAVKVLFHDIQVSAGAFSGYPHADLPEDFLKGLFLTFLERNTCFGHHIRFLRIYFVWDPEDEDSPTGDAHYGIPAEVINRVLQLLPRMEGLSLSRVLFRDPAKLIASETWRPTSLQSLAIDFALRFIMPLGETYERLSCDQELGKIFVHFTGVRNLTLAGYNHIRNNTVSDSEQVKGFPPALRSLTLRSSYPHGNLLNSISTSVSGGTLQNLFISVFSDIAKTLQDKLNRFLADVGPALTSIGYGAERKPVYSQHDVLEAFFACTYATHLSMSAL